MRISYSSSTLSSWDPTSSPKVSPTKGVHVHVHMVLTAALIIFIFKKTKQYFFRDPLEDQIKKWIQKPSYAFEKDRAQVALLLKENYEKKEIELNLTGYRITRLPEFFSHFFHLQSLAISDTLIRNLPRHPDRLCHLSILILDGNQFEQIPKEILSLPELEVLSLKKNFIYEIKDCFPSSCTLQHLILSQNRIRHLPPSLFRLKSLKSLDLSRNELRELPDLFDGLTNLRSVMFCYNKIKELPPSLFSQQLKILNVAHNLLSSLPQTLSQACQLSYLDVANNDLISLDEHIDCLQELLGLNLSNNSLEYLPSSLGLIHRLSFLDISYNPQLTSLPLSWMHLCGLRSMQIDGTCIPCYQIDTLLEGIMSQQAGNPLTLSKTLALWAGYANVSLAELPNLSVSEQDKLEEWLLRLEHSYDFKRGHEDMAKATVHILTGLHTPAFKQVFFSEIHEALTACEDRALVTLILLFLYTEILCPRDLPEGKEIRLLTKAATSLYLPEVVREIFCQPHQLGESSEIYLYMLSKLQKTLDLLLPWDDFSMHHEAFTLHLLQRGNHPDLSDVIHKVQSFSKEALLLHLIPSAVERFLKKHQPTSLAAILAKREHALEKAESSCHLMSDLQYQQALHHIEKDQKNQTMALLKELYFSKNT
ncbi:MAG: hypothetical protein EBZ47_03525 [Chlamydiae bacterium]|nr:hypothetical protein [Chlamydiota bacterium]